MIDTVEGRVEAYVLKDMILAAQDRVMMLQRDYDHAQKCNAFGLSAIIKGEINAARAYLQALKDVRERVK